MNKKLKIYFHLWNKNKNSVMLRNSHGKTQKAMSYNIKIGGKNVARWVTKSKRLGCENWT